MAAEEEVRLFLYTGRGGDGGGAVDVEPGPADPDVARGERVPGWATHVRVDPSVSVVSDGAFQYRPRLRRAELHDGLASIGRAAFFDCGSLESIEVPPSVREVPEGCFQHCVNLADAVLHEGLEAIGTHAFDGCTSLSLGRAGLPSTVRSIGKSAFFNALSSIELPDGVESVGDYALSQCRIARLRLPPPLAEAALGLCRSCKQLFALEVPEGIRCFRDHAFASCQSLRNAFVPRDAEVMEHVFQHCTDLERLFGSHVNIENELRRRFDGLPIHRICYFQSYRPAEAAVAQLEDAIGAGSPSPDPTGGERDRLGMTPLHILCCSGTQRLDLHRIVVGAYPRLLVAEDKWGAPPILYAFWGGAPGEVVWYLIEQHRSRFPDRDLDWTGMVRTLGLANAPRDAIQHLLDVRASFFPDRPVAWDGVLDALAEPYASFKDHYASAETFRFVLSCGVAERAERVGLRRLRAQIYGAIDLVRDGHRSRKFDLRLFRSTVARYEGEYLQLKEATVALELALWKARMAEVQNVDTETDAHESEFRIRCRVNCGADHVIENVLPFLLPTDDNRLIMTDVFPSAGDVCPVVNL